MSEECGNLPESDLPPGFCAYKLPVRVVGPRDIIIAPGTINHLLVVEIETRSIVLVEDSDGDGILDSRRIIARADGLNHSLVWFDGYLYASSQTTVYRWPYPATGVTEEIVTPPEVVVNNMSDGPTLHTSRALKFLPDGILYVQNGARWNVDDDSYLAVIRRFDVSDSSLFPIDYETGEVFADGLRNTVSVDVDKHGVLWGMDMNPEFLIRDDLGGYLSENNPCDELNKFPQENLGKSYGYPYCWTEYNIPDFGMGRGTQWLWPRSFDEGLTDDYCRDEENNIPPAMAIQAHSASLGMEFYNWSDDLPAECDPSEAFPQEMNGDLFMALHGSVTRIVPTGYKVVQVKMTDDGDIDYEASDEPIDLLKHEGEDARWGNFFRPLGVAFDKCGRLFVSSSGGTLRNKSPIGRGKLIQIIKSDCCPVTPEEQVPPAAVVVAIVALVKLIRAII